VVAARTYIANARAALAQAPAGTVIIDQRVPTDVMIPFYGSGSDTSVVLGPLARPGAHVIWTTQPAGNVGGVKMFGPDGRLDAALIQGVSALPASCLTPRRSQLTVQLPTRAGLGPLIRVLRIDYLADTAASGESVTVTYNGIASKILITGNRNNFYMAVSGAASVVTLQATLTAGSFCPVKAVAGYFITLPSPLRA
jgi:hypothetical protein